MIESPISNLDSIDVVGARKDGGLDLIISSSRNIDSSADTLARLERKIFNYLHEIGNAKNPTIRERFGCSEKSLVRIIVSCPHGIHQDALLLVNRMAAEAKLNEIQVLVKGMSE